MTTPTQQEVREAWANALSEWEQDTTNAQLRSRDRDGKKCGCVNGVLIDVVAPESWIVDDFDGYRVFYLGNTHVAFIPPQIRNEAGLSEEAEAALYHLNDAFKLPFSELADVIRTGTWYAKLRELENAK